MRRAPILYLAFAFVLVFLFPLVLGQMMVASLAKLHLSPNAAAFVLFLIIIGSLINIPIKHIQNRAIRISPLAVFGVPSRWQEVGGSDQETVIAVNFGGCLVPIGLALYQLLYIGPELFAQIAYSSAISIVSCYLLARPLPGVGIALPAFAPPLLAVALALIFAPSQAAPYAFFVGVVGPLIGADLLHLKEIKRWEASRASGARGRSMASYCLESLPLIWRDAAATTCREHFPTAKDIVCRCGEN